MIRIKARQNENRFGDFMDKLQKIGKTEKAVVFDMDGVLFDTERLCRESWTMIAKEQNLSRIDDVLTECTGTNREATIRIMKKAYGEDFDAIGFMNISSEINTKRIEKEGIPIKKGAREILYFLREENYKIGLASSTRKYRILDNLEKSGLTDFFQVIIGGDMIKHSKPEPDIYLLACKELAVSPEGTYAVEDSPNGIRAAYSAGMMPVMVPDLLEPTEEILALTVTCKKDLLQVMEYLKNNNKC